MQKLEGLGSGFGAARYRSPRTILSLFLLLFLFKIPASYAYANDTLTQSQKLSVRQTITSRGEIFYLGFFTPGNSNNQYLGIWHKNTHDRKVVWVANRKHPIPATDTEASLVIGKDGNLRLLDGKSTLIWQTNSTFPSNITVAILSDNGDFTLQDNISGLVLWESFNYPCDTLLPGMNIGQNAETGEKISLSSWKSNDDPSPGEFVAGLTTDRPPQSFVWNGSKPYWRGGPWDGGKFIGIPDSSDGYASNFKLLPNNYLTLIPYSANLAVFMSLTPAGSLQIMQQDNVTDDLYISWLAPGNPCDIYGVCGPFGVCNKNKSIICECLKGFVPKYIDEWNKGNWGGGCYRRSELLCQRNLSTTPVKAKADGFWKLSGVKLPDHFQLFPVPEKCQQWCMDNCSCLAYAFLERIGCMVWLGDLSDIQEFSYNGNDLFLRLAHSELGKS